MRPKNTQISIMRNQKNDYYSLYNFVFKFDIKTILSIIKGFKSFSEIGLIY